MDVCMYVYVCVHKHTYVYVCVCILGKLKSGEIIVNYEEMATSEYAYYK